MKILLVIFCLITVSAISCEPKDGDDIVFEGIMYTDEYGNMMRAPDPSDWTLTDKWVEKEENLFAEKKENVCSYEDDEFKIYAFPNPCQRETRVLLKMPDQFTCSYRIVDQDFNVLISVDNETIEPPAEVKIIDIDLSGFDLPTDMVRVYYKFFGADCELKGHGDIQVDYSPF